MHKKWNANKRCSTAHDSQHIHVRLLHHKDETKNKEFWSKWNTQGIKTLETKFMTSKLIRAGVPLSSTHPDPLKATLFGWKVKESHPIQRIHAKQHCMDVVVVCLWYAISDTSGAYIYWMVFKLCATVCRDSPTLPADAFLWGLITSCSLVLLEDGPWLCEPDPWIPAWGGLAGSEDEGEASLWPPDVIREPQSFGRWPNKSNNRSRHGGIVLGSTSCSETWLLVAGWLLSCLERA